MILKVRDIVKLFRLAKHKNKVHQKFFAFSISYAATTMKIYSYYPLINRKNITYFRHFIRLYDITDKKGKEK